MPDVMFKPKSQTRKGRLASRGKSAEDKIKAVFAPLLDRKVFDFERNYDARSAGGIAFARRTGDFTWYAQGRHGAIEVKEVEHGYRLPFKNLENHQLAKLRRRAWAGGEVVVLVRFMPEDVWRQVGIDDLPEKTSPSGSWDLSFLPTYATLTEVPYIKGLLHDYNPQ